MAKKAKKMQIKRDVKKGKKKKVKSEPEWNKNMYQEIYCYGCTFYLNQTIELLRGKQNESEVIDVMSYVCESSTHEKRLEGRDYLPPAEGKRGCYFFADDWDEELEQWLINRDALLPIDTFVDDICYEKTDSCVRDP